MLDGSGDFRRFRKHPPEWGFHYAVHYAPPVETKSKPFSVHQPGELHYSTHVVERVYAHLGDVRVRSDEVEYRIDEFPEKQAALEQGRTAGG